MNLKPNKRILKVFRQRLRNRSTPAESELWRHLKNKNLSGRKFRRQHSIGNFIVDFFCPQEKLIIELDGEYHGDYYKIQQDEKRDKTLMAEGYRIIRFENRFVFQDPDWVKEEIKKAFGSVCEPPPPDAKGLGASHG